MSYVRLTYAAALAAMLSACAHGGSTSRVCAAPAHGQAEPTRATSQRFVVLADEAHSTNGNACTPAAPIKCDGFASSPHPWCNTQPYGL